MASFSFSLSTVAILYTKNPPTTKYQNWLNRNYVFLVPRLRFLGFQLLSLLLLPVALGALAVHRLAAEGGVFERFWDHLAVR
jgi:hypothetical protein